VKAAEELAQQAIGLVRIHKRNPLGTLPRPAGTAGRTKLLPLALQHAGLIRHVACRGFFVHERSSASSSVRFIALESCGPAAISTDKRS
jgi:hypothetical protein